MKLVGSGAAPTVIVVEDDSAVRDSLGALLAMSGFSTRLFGSGDAVLGAVAQLHADCCLIDFTLPDCNGVQLVVALNQAGIRVPTILMTAHDEVDALIGERPSSIDAVLTKPANDTLLIHTIGRLLTNSSEFVSE